MIPKEISWLASSREEVYEGGNKESTQEVEYEARVGFEAEDTGGDAKKRGGQGTDVGYNLVVVLYGFLDDGVNC